MNRIDFQENAFVLLDIPVQHVNSNVMQIDGAKIVHHFVNVVLVNATLLMVLATVHQVRTNEKDQNLILN